MISHFINMLITTYDATVMLIMLIRLDQTINRNLRECADCGHSKKYHPIHLCHAAYCLCDGFTLVKPIPLPSPPKLAPSRYIGIALDKQYAALVNSFSPYSDPTLASGMMNACAAYTDYTGVVVDMVNCRISSGLPITTLARFLHHALKGASADEDYAIRTYFRHAGYGYLLDAGVLSFLPSKKTDEHILAWRAWKVLSIGTKVILRSVVSKTLWPWGEPLEADWDGDDSHGAVTNYGKGTTRRGYGIYAAKTLAGAQEARKNWSGAVYGTVALWGKVIEHKHGYRAQYAYPQTLYVADGENAQRLRNLYGCEVTPMEGIKWTT